MEMNTNQQLWMVKAVLIAQIRPTVESIWASYLGSLENKKWHNIPLSSASQFCIFFSWASYILHIKVTERPSYSSLVFWNMISNRRSPRMCKTRGCTASFLTLTLFIFHLLVQSHFKTFVILASTVTCGNKILNVVMCFEGKVFSSVCFSLVLDLFTFQTYKLFGLFCCLCWKFAFKIIFAASLQ